MTKTLKINIRNFLLTATREELEAEKENRKERPEEVAYINELIAEWFPEKEAVYVVHKNDPRHPFTGEFVPFELVAKIETEYLGVAWRRTNNIKGSWSKGEILEDPIKNTSRVNSDYSPEITVIKELTVVGPVTYGHRSSMVGDLFVTNVDPKKDKWGKEIRVFRVKPFGFEELKKLTDADAFAVAGIVKDYVEESICRKTAVA